MNNKLLGSLLLAAAVLAILGFYSYVILMNNIEISKTENILRQEIGEPLLNILSGKIKLGKNLDQYEEKYSFSDVSQVSLLVIGFSSKKYILESGYEGGKWSYNLLKEKEKFNKLSPQSKDREDFVDLEMCSLRFLLKELGGCKFQISETAFPPAASAGKTYLTFIDNYLIIFNYNASMIVSKDVKFIDPDVYGKGLIIIGREKRNIEALERMIGNLKLGH